MPKPKSKLKPTPAPHCPSPATPCLLPRLGVAVRRELSRPANRVVVDLPAVAVVARRASVGSKIGRPHPAQATSTLTSSKRSSLPQARHRVRDVLSICAFYTYFMVFVAGSQYTWEYETVPHDVFIKYAATKLGSPDLEELQQRGTQNVVEMLRVAEEDATPQVGPSRRKTKVRYYLIRIVHINKPKPAGRPTTSVTCKTKRWRLAPAANA
jgi:hypothetical protein